MTTELEILFTEKRFKGREAANQALLAEAAQYYGMQEVNGPESNKRLLQLIRSYNAGVFSWVRDDSKIAWCSIAAQAVVLGACAQKDDRTNAGATALARSWMYSGDPVPLDRWMPGDVAVLTRGGGNPVPGANESAKSFLFKPGHVTFVMAIRDGYIYGLGGNQRNGFNVGKYKASSLIGLRRLYLIEPVSQLKLLP